MLMDCSHTGYRTSLDIMALSAAPVIYSHANPRALADNGRNIRDEQIDACVATGAGVVLQVLCTRVEGQKLIERRRHRARA
jgi:membrane dipeptidase